MQVKTFTGASNKEVLDMIKASLGSEAVILDTRTSTAGGVKVITMTAALEREEAVPGNERQEDGFGPGSAGGPAGASPQLPKHFLDEWDNIKKHLFALMKPALNLDRLSPSQRTALEYLQREGAGDQVLLELYRRLSKSPGDPVLTPLSAMLPVKPWGLEHWPQRVHLVAGPYGSGKTTTAVRMALAYEKSRSSLVSRGSRLEGSSGKVCIVNADTDRGGGRLLLKHYAGLSDFAYREAGNAMEMRGVLSEIAAQGFDRVIVDLPALSSGGHLRDFASSLGLYNSNSAIKTALHLVLPPSHDDSFTLTLLDRYHLDLPGSVVWSKLDEFSRYGALLNVALASGLPISALSFGSGILNTLLPATQVMLWRLIFKHELPLHLSHTGQAGSAGPANSPAAAYARALNQGEYPGGEYPGDDI